MKIKGRTITILILLLLISIFFDVYNLTPLDYLGKYLNLSCAVVSLLLVFFLRYTKQDILLLFMFLTLWIISFYTAINFQKQGVVDNLIANLPLLSVVGAVVIPKFFNKRIVRISLEQWYILFSSLIILNCIILLVFSGLNIYIDFPSSFLGPKITMYPEKIPRKLVELGFFIYILKYIQEGGTKNIFLFLLTIISYHSADIQRVVLFSSIAVITYILWVNMRNKNSFSIVSFIVVSVLMLIITIDLFPSLDIYIEDLAQVFRFLEFEEKVLDDYSAIARIQEIDYAKKYIESSPIIGNGLPRASLKDNLLGGEYFFVRDIGLYGILYVYGFIGLMVYFVQVILSVKNIVQSKLTLNYFSKAIAFYLVYLSLKSVSTGDILFDSHHFVFCLYLFTITKYYETKRG